MSELAVDPRGKVFVRTTGNNVLHLAAVPAARLPQLIAASGQDLETGRQVETTQ